MVADTPVPSPQPTVHPSIQPTALPTLSPTLKPTNYPTFSIDSSKISMGAVESPVMRANTLEVNLLVVSGDTFDARRLRRRLGHAGIGGPLGEGMSGEGDEHWEFAAPEERGEGARFSAASAVEGLRAEVRALAEIVGDSRQPSSDKASGCSGRTASSRRRRKSSRGSGRLSRLSLDFGTAVYGELNAKCKKAIVSALVLKLLSSIKGPGKVEDGTNDDDDDVFEIEFS